MNDLAGRFTAAKRPNWPFAGCDGDSILRILTNGLGREAGVGGVGKRRSCKIDEAGRDFDSCGRVRYLISGGQFEGNFGVEDDGRWASCIDGVFPRDDLGLGLLDGMVG